jgi:hypothetical protein
MNNRQRMSPLSRARWVDPDPVGSESKISILSGPGPEIFLLLGPGPKISDMMNFS